MAKRSRVRSQSTRSSILELLAIVIAVAAIYLWLSNGGPAAFGSWFAGFTGTP